MKVFVRALAPKISDAECDTARERDHDDSEGRADESAPDDRLSPFVPV